MTLDVSTHNRASRKTKRSSTPKPTLWSVYDPKNPKPLRAEKVKKSQDKWHTFNASDFSSSASTSSATETRSFYSSSSSSSSSSASTNVQTGFSMYSAQSTTSVAVVTSPVYLARHETTSVSQTSPTSTEMHTFVPAMSHTSSSSLSSSSSPSPRHNGTFNVAPRRGSFSPFDVYQSDLLGDSIFGPYGLGFDLLGADHFVSEIPASEPQPSSSSSSSSSSSYMADDSPVDAFPRPARSSSLFSALCPSSESTFYTEFAPIA